MFNNNLIYHCSPAEIRGAGGVGTYINSLLRSQMRGISQDIIDSFTNLNLSKFKLLHLHDPIMLLDWNRECPVVFSQHNHASYCPSGTKYLSTQHKPCDRAMSIGGCTWGHIVDGCGSRRPNVFISQQVRTHQFLDILKTGHVPVIAYSRYVSQQLINHGVPPESVNTLYYGICLPQYPTAPLSREIHQNQRIFFAGRIVPDKGLEWLLKTLTHTHPHIHLDIAGEGWDKPRLMQLTHKLGLDHRVTWHGWCEKDKLEALYTNCFAVVFPSVWHEPAGLITLEAYARYRPVIASQVGGIPEHIIPNQTGILVPVNHRSALAEAINMLADDCDRSRILGERGHELLMEKFTIDIHMQGLQAIYDRYLELSNRQSSQLVSS